MSAAPNEPPRRTYYFRSDDPRFPGFSEEHRRRAKEVMNGTNLAEMVLYAHLLLEQALETLIRVRLKRPDALEDRSFARLIGFG